MVTSTGERGKTIKYRFSKVKSTKQRVIGASIRATHNDYATRPRTLDPLHTAYAVYGVCVGIHLLISATYGLSGIHRTLANSESVAVNH